MRWLPMFDVMMTSVLRKSTVRPWPSVKPAVVEHLQQHVEDVAVCLFDLVEEDDAVGLATDRLGELAALLVTDVTRRSAEQPGDVVFLLVFRHVDADHRPLVVEEELRQRPCQLGLADAGRSQEDE